MTSHYVQLIIHFGEFLKIRIFPCSRITRNDSEETDTESSSQHSQTGKDFEFVDREDSDMKS